MSVPQQCREQARLHITREGTQNERRWLPELMTTFYILDTLLVPDPYSEKKIQKARLCKPSGKITLAAERCIKLSDIRRLDRDLRCTFSSNTQARQQQMKHMQRRGVFCTRHVAKLNNSFPQAAVVPENLQCSCSPVRLHKIQRKHSRLGNSGTKTWLLGSTQRMSHLDAHSLLILPFGHGMRQGIGLDTLLFPSLSILPQSPTLPCLPESVIKYLKGEQGSCAKRDVWSANAKQKNFITE